jgi:NAD(P)-dependent dehydrogenase (short-subunit alcohol dehydrogenase family)
MTLNSFDNKRQNKRLAIAELRKTVSAAAGRPMIITCHDDADSLQKAREHSITKLFETPSLTKESLDLIGILPMTGKDVAVYSQKISQLLPNSKGIDRAPQLIFDDELGICSVGRTFAEAQSIFEKTDHIIDLLLSTNKQSTSNQRNSEEENKSCEFNPSNEKSALFMGEVALVTGAASGIGKACVESLLERGATVVGLDINPTITTIYSNSAYLGVICDLSKEFEIIRALEETVHAFGGLDMLILNAGIFPASCKIALLQLADWHKSFSLNLDANLVLLRESYPLFKLAPRHGRVAVNSSRNVPAPGPGAASYSASKAALTQLARVAALEWGKDHINVNMVNPHAVFDTGIWTDDVLKNRAANYNMTVDQYKKNNVLQVELTSRDIAEMLAEMCGPLFEKTTGAQVPMDGGSDRVI